MSDRRIAALFVWRCCVILLSVVTLGALEGLINGPTP